MFVILIKAMPRCSEIVKHVYNVDITTSIKILKAELNNFAFNNILLGKRREKDA